MQGSYRRLAESFRHQYNWNKPHTRYAFAFFTCLLVVGTYFSNSILDISVSTKTCPADYYPSALPTIRPRSSSIPPTCPHYFHWIHEDLRPWKDTGITEEMVLRANRTANFRLVILNGRAYLETYVKSFQTRDVFTLWGILQLLIRYPGKVPDLDLMFDCVDWPVIKSSAYQGPNALKPPPLFRYCGNNQTFDIAFPDWSFWGWEPYAFWKGNPKVAEKRVDLLKCNVSAKQDWNARVYKQDWDKEIQEGFKESDLAKQCTHRYKIYIEGSAWSHYWPIKAEDKCRSIKFAVDWGNNQKEKAQELGTAASSFVQNDLKMDFVYDYMFHLLSEYSKLLRYKPKIPPKAVELCSEAMACHAQGLEKTFMLDSMVKSPKESSPCSMPPPLEPSALKQFIERKQSSIKQVELGEQKYWEEVQDQQRRCFVERWMGTFSYVN
ncbi:UNVERIFIED_CONTAM: O-glucosyltransferase rumi [Sesamum radiatum]|uniref:O-glucosyltransferase rumi n=1 Tax=Sesamum radiatum TaxID=300843 RepID=A0AAW2JZG0_SESRA